jgi:hypothetical protein
MNILRRLFTGASILWAASLPIATFAASRPAASSVVYVAALAVYAVGALVCHQRPERSFYVWAHQMPVCARCTGIYAGAALMALCWPVVRAFQPNARRSPRADRWAAPYARAVLASAALPSLATLAYEWTTGVTPSNWVRAASGLCLGAAVAALIQREVEVN